MRGRAIQCPSGWPTDVSTAARSPILPAGAGGHTVTQRQGVTKGTHPISATSPNQRLRQRMRWRSSRNCERLNDEETAPATAAPAGPTCSNEAAAGFPQTSAVPERVAAQQEHREWLARTSVELGKGISLARLNEKCPSSVRIAPVTKFCRQGVFDCIDRPRVTRANARIQLPAAEQLLKQPGWSAAGPKRLAGGRRAAHPSGAVASASRSCLPTFSLDNAPVLPTNRSDSADALYLEGTRLAVEASIRPDSIDAGRILVHPH